MNVCFCVSDSACVCVCSPCLASPAPVPAPTSMRLEPVPAPTVYRPEHSRKYAREHAEHSSAKHTQTQIHCRFLFFCFFADRRKPRTAPQDNTTPHHTTPHHNPPHLPTQNHMALIAFRDRPPLLGHHRLGPRPEERTRLRNPGAAWPSWSGGSGLPPA